MSIIHTSSSSALSVSVKDRSLAFISLCVIFIHFLLILWATFSSTKSPPKIPSPPKRLVVQTIPLNSQPIAANTKTASPKKKIAPAPPAPEPAPIIEEPKLLPEPELIVEKEPVSKKEEVVEEAAPTPKKVPESQPEPEPDPEVISEKPAKVTPTPAKKEEKKPAKVKKPVKDKAKTPSKKKDMPKSETKSEPKSESKPVTTKTPAKPAKPKADKKPPVDTKKKAEEAKALAEKNKKLEQEKAAKAQQQKKLSEAQERIAKISQTRDKLSAGKSNDLGDVVVLGEITSLHVDSLASADGIQMSPREVNYRDELVRHMKLRLKLPKYGEVKIKLTLARSGKVIKAIVVSAENQANRKHIEETLPTLSFPAFGNNFGDVHEHTFLITLKNEV